MQGREAAVQVEEAFRAGDAAGLTALASADAPDPWLVADELLRRGQVEAARAFAAAAIQPLPGLRETGGHEEAPRHAPRVVTTDRSASREPRWIAGLPPISLLVGRREVVYAPSGTTWLHLRQGVRDRGEGCPAPEALRKAQEFVRGHERWKHPSYWAAWVLWGLPD